MPFFSLPSGASPVLAGSGGPTGTLGNIGDIYLDTSGAYLWGPKTISGWGATGINLSLGPTGPVSNVTGPTGAGATGPTGNFPFAATGPTAPAGLTLAGSVWLDDSTGKYFVRYDTVWLEIGVQGERGSTGPTGAASTITGPTGGTPTVATGPTPDSILINGILVQAAQGATGPTGPTGAASTVTGPTGSIGGFSDAQLINAQDQSYTLVLTDAGKLVTLATGSGDLVVTVPALSSVLFPTGTHVDIARLGDASVTVTGAAGVTINATPGRSLRAKYSAGTLIQYVGDTWLLVGDLS